MSLRSVLDGRRQAHQSAEPRRQSQYGKAVLRYRFRFTVRRPQRFGQSPVVPNRFRLAHQINVLVDVERGYDPHSFGPWFPRRLSLSSPTRHRSGESDPTDQSEPRWRGLGRAPIGASQSGSVARRESEPRKALASPTMARGSEN